MVANSRACASASSPVLPPSLPRMKVASTSGTPTTTHHGRWRRASTPVRSPSLLVDVPLTQAILNVARVPTQVRLRAPVLQRLSTLPPAPPPARTSRSTSGTPTTKQHGRWRCASTPVRSPSVLVDVPPTPPSVHVARVPTQVSPRAFVWDSSSPLPPWRPLLRGDLMCSTPITRSRLAKDSALTTAHCPLAVPRMSTSRCVAVELTEVSPPTIACATPSAFAFLAGVDRRPIALPPGVALILPALKVERRYVYRICV